MRKRARRGGDLERSGAQGEALVEVQPPARGQRYEGPREQERAGDRHQLSDPNSKPLSTRLRWGSVPEDRRSGRENRPDPLLLLPGALWGTTLFVAFGFRMRPAPESAGEVALLFFLALFVGTAHAGVFAALANALGRAPFGGRLGALLLALCAGAGYAWLGLSLAKYSATRVHLRYDDLWFLATSAAQAGGEGTRAERVWLSAAALSPLIAAGLLYLLLRVARRRGLGFPAGAAGVLILAGIAGLATTAWRYPVAERVLVDRFPDTSALISLWESARARDVTAGWRPDPARHARLEARLAPEDPQPWNVLVVMLESVSWKRLLGPDARPASTPNLLALARESIDFQRAYATSTHSDYAQTSILGSHYPRTTQRHDYFTHLDYPRALPWDVLGVRGWRSAVISTQNEGWGNMIAFLRTPHLELLRHAPDYPEAPHRGEGRQTKLFEQTVVEELLDWVAGAPERPFVAYVNFQATHYPYVWPEGFEPPFGPSPIDFPATFLEYPPEKTPVMLDRFHNALAYIDLWTGRLVEGLQRTGVWDRTVVLVVADHGEAFHEHGLVTHGTTLLDEQLRVPMWIRVPGLPARVVEEPVSTLDALPTIYRAMGLARDPALQGSDEILEPERRNALDAELAGFLLDQLGYYRSSAWEEGWGPPLPPGTR